LTLGPKVFFCRGISHLMSTSPSTCIVKAPSSHLKKRSLLFWLREAVPIQGRAMSVWSMLHVPVFLSYQCLHPTTVHDNNMTRTSYTTAPAFSQELTNKQTGKKLGLRNKLGSNVRL
jgi:hypothetical protein